MNQHDHELPEDEQEIEIEAIGIDVSSQPIELYKVFKIANLVGGGGEAKHIISEGYVAVNGELETRKRRKMYDGDFFEFNEEYYVVVCDQPVQDVVEPKKPKAPQAKSPSSKSAKTASSKATKTSSASKKSKSEQGNKKSNKDKQHALSASAKPKANNKKANKSQKTPSLEPVKKQRDEKSGRNSIDFF